MRSLFSMFPNNRAAARAARDADIERVLMQTPAFREHCRRDIREGFDRAKMIIGPYQLERMTDHYVRFCQQHGNKVEIRHSYLRGVIDGVREAACD
jgi:predicted phosphoribosyltransferase